MSLSRLWCPHCPCTFKSQHGRTYHIRAVHVNSNTLNRRRQDDNPPNGNTEDGTHFTNDLSEYGPSAVSQRKEHPYLTGLYTLHAVQGSEQCNNEIV